MSRLDPQGRTTLRWGVGIAILLGVQSLLMAGLFWVFALGGHVADMERSFAEDCAAFEAIAPLRRPGEVQAALKRDIHRDRFLALFAASGQMIAGNVAAIPAGSGTGSRSILSSVIPTQLPGKTSDTARLRLCRMPDGTRLLTGFDLDDSNMTMRVICRALLFGLLPGLFMAVAFACVAARTAGRQIDTVRRLSQAVLAGDLKGRIAVSDQPDSFGLLCAHINRMLDRIEALVTEVRGIGDDIAHQIRTPLTRLRARIEREMDAAASVEAFRSVADAALSDIDLTLAIVRALLRIREIEDHARRSGFAPIEMAQLIEDAVDLHAPSAEEHAVTLQSRIEAGATIAADADLLMEALSNLIENAVKFGPYGGRVEVVLRTPGDLVEMTVTDEGSGIGSDERHLVTQRFYRGGRPEPGCGLGLSLVKAIVDLHDAELEFQPRAEGSFSSVSIRFARAGSFLN